MLTFLFYIFKFNINKNIKGALAIHILFGRYDFSVIPDNGSETGLTSINQIRTFSSTDQR